jgi:hypothetical protein
MIRRLFRFLIRWLKRANLDGPGIYRGLARGPRHGDE